MTDSFDVELRIGDPVIAFRTNKTPPRWKGPNPGPASLYRGYVKAFGKGEKIKRALIELRDYDREAWFDMDKVAYAEWDSESITARMYGRHDY